MKLHTQIRNLAFCLCSALLFSYTVHGQSANMGSASIAGPKSIILQNNPHSPSRYQADITALNFKSKAQAEAYFGRITDNLLSYELDYVAKKVIITIHKERIPATWTTGTWNKYIHAKINNL